MTANYELNQRRRDAIDLNFKSEVCQGTLYSGGDTCLKVIYRSAHVHKGAHFL